MEVKRQCRNCAYYSNSENFCWLQDFFFRPDSGKNCEDWKSNDAGSKIQIVAAVANEKAQNQRKASR